MKRRQFIAWGSAGVVIYGAGIGTGLWLAADRGGANRPVEEQLETFARSLQGVASAGRAWIGVNPEADPLAELLRQLGLHPSSGIDRETLMDAVARTIESDFEHSRLFDHDGWQLSETEARLSALHVMLLGDQASEARQPDFGQAPQRQLVDLEHFDPRQVRQGDPIQHPSLPDNVIYFGIGESPPPRYVVYLDDHRLTINSSANGFSIRVPDPVRYAMFEEPGEHPIWLYDPVTNERQMLGVFTVVEASPETNAADFCPITAWGPQSTVAGQPFNEQPDGASALWIRCDCFPEETVVVFGNERVKTTLRPADGLITTHITDHSLYAGAGELHVELLDQSTGATVSVGVFRILAE